MSWVIIQSLINGILTGGIYALVASGITIVFGVMKVVNFAVGEYITFGMYMAYVAYLITGWNTYALLPFVLLATAIIGLVTFRLCIKPLLGRDSTSFILVTFGLSYALMNLLQMIFGGTPLNVPSDIKTASLQIGSFQIPIPRLIGFCVSFIIIILVDILIRKTRFGRALRATAENSEVAETLGINSTRGYELAFIIGIVLAGIAGLLLTPFYLVSPTAGSTMKTTALMIVVLGGMGNIRGAFIGGLMVGVVEALVSTLIATELGPAGIFVVFLIVVYFKPQGLFGKEGRVG